MIDENGQSDPNRLPILYNLIPESTRITSDTQLFKIYIFPFIGNRAQGNAMKSFGNNSVVSAWSNKWTSKYTDGIPIKVRLTEDWAAFENL